MDAIRLSVHIGEDRKLAIDLPRDIPMGFVEVLITSPRRTEQTYMPEYPEQWRKKREQLRKTMLEAGILSSEQHTLDGTIPLSPEELLRIGTLPPGSKSTVELIQEDRGVQ